MICTMSTGSRISCIGLSALIPAVWELINHPGTIGSCLRGMITACFQHLAGHLIIWLADWLVGKQLSGQLFSLSTCRTFSSCFFGCFQVLAFESFDEIILWFAALEIINHCGQSAYAYLDCTQSLFIINQIISHSRLIIWCSQWMIFANGDIWPIVSHKYKRKAFKYQFFRFKSKRKWCSW